jgi:hypothetical protein
VMEALPSLALGLSHSSLVFQMTFNISNVSSSLGDRGGTFHDVPCYNCETLFFQRGMVSYKSIVKLISSSST